MHKIHILFLIFLVGALNACASTTLKIYSVNSLESSVENSASFKGLERLADALPESDVKRINIIYLHGVGWIENPEDTPLANNFITGVANGYSLVVEDKVVSSVCGRQKENEQNETQNHIIINNTKPLSFQTTLPGSEVILDDLVCMDKQVLRVNEDLEYVFYRIFWDEIFWSKLQYPHIGQDDNVNSKDDVASLRRRYNGYLKDKLINFGFSDAVMYLGPAGQEIRDAIRGAMCSAALDSAGFSFQQQGHKTDFETVCQTASNTNIISHPFAFVTESLGSKIAYDIMREAMTDGQDNIHDEMIKGTELYMLANQIALLSLNDLSPDARMAPALFNDEDRPTIIALSEVNDFLTYELVPFYRQLLQNSNRVSGDLKDISEEGYRRTIRDLLGFNVVDMRVEFASPLIPLVSGFVDPLYAHNGHSRQPELMRYILCGSKHGQINELDCASSRSTRGLRLTDALGFNAP